MTLPAPGDTARVWVARLVRSEGGGQVAVEVLDEQLVPVLRGGVPCEWIENLTQRGGEVSITLYRPPAHVAPPGPACAHCGRTTGDIAGGSATVGGLPVCHPNEPGRPDCYRAITVYGHRRQDCDRCRPAPVTTTP